MKRNLLLAACCTIGAYAAQAQVTQISANKDLEYVAPLGTTKAVFSSATDNRLYVSDGTTAGTILLSSTISYDDNSFTLPSNKVVFKGISAATGSELFITDGTPGGTVLLKDISAGTTSSDIGDDMALLNGNVFFTAANGTYGREIWKTDGTPGGTVMLKDIASGPASSNLASDYNLFSNNSYLLFSAQTATGGMELWKSDGTEAGTVELKDINPGALSSNAEAFFQLGNFVLFQANHASYGKEIWKTDGTAAGTVLVKDIYAGPVGSSSMLSTFFTALNGKALFDATDGVNGEEIWTTDGTTAGTVMVKDVQAGPTGSFNLLINSMKIGNKIIFPSTNLFGTRYQLWETDGTTNGTNMLKDFTPGGELPIIFATYMLNGTTVSQPLFQGNKFFFMAATPAEGLELWISDGTASGTVLVKNINPGAANSLDEISYQYTTDGLYFAADDGVHGTELWKSNGTETGTVMVADINVGSGSSSPTLWPFFNNKLSLSANNGDNAATDLYVLNGNINPLPIKLENFTVRLSGKDGLLQWATTQEVNTSHFLVQRSADGSNFETIGTVQAAGNSATQRSYRFTDANVTNANGIYAGKTTIYYRLIAVDVDDKKETTRVISLLLQNKNWTATLLNNPVRDAATINVSGLTSSASVKLTDVSGKVYFTNNNWQNGLHNIDMSRLNNGMYLITVESKEQKFNLKLIKQ